MNNIYEQVDNFKNAAISAQLPRLRPTHYSQTTNPAHPNPPNPILPPSDPLNNKENTPTTKTIPAADLSPSLLFTEHPTLIDRAIHIIESISTFKT